MPYYLVKLPQNCAIVRNFCQFFTVATGASAPAPPPPPSTTSNRGLVFLYNITKDNINICQTGNLIFALARNNQDFAESVAAMVFQGLFVCVIFFQIRICKYRTIGNIYLNMLILDHNCFLYLILGVKMTDYYMNFFRLLTMLTELPGAGGPPGMPCFTR